MKDIMRLFPHSTRVEVSLDNLHQPCGYEVVMRVPEDRIGPECDEIICRLPDGMDEDKARRAEVIAAIPEMLDRLGDHCEWCADCDWRGNPDQECRFGQMWKRLRGEE